MQDLLSHPLCLELVNGGITCDKDYLANRDQNITPLLQFCRFLELRHAHFQEHQLVDHRTWYGLPYENYVAHGSVNMELTIFIFYKIYFSRCRHYRTVENASAIFNNRHNVSAHRELINACV